MAFLLNKTAISILRLCPQKADDSIALSRRGLHGDLDAREKALLAEDSLKRFKSNKKIARRLKRLKIVGDVLTAVFVTGCCYEVYVGRPRRQGRGEKSI